MQYASIPVIMKPNAGLPKQKDGEVYYDVEPEEFASYMEEIVRRGLIVGIIAMFAYNYLVMLVDRVVNKMESRTMEFMDLLNEPAQK